MINLQNIPNQMISGVSESCMNFVTEQSNDRYVFELDPNFLKLLDETENFNSILTEEEEEEELKT